VGLVDAEDRQVQAELLRVPVLKHLDDLLTPTTEFLLNSCQLDVGIRR
jgi:hypothetical protein